MTQVLFSQNRKLALPRLKTKLEFLLLILLIHLWKRNSCLEMNFTFIYASQGPRGTTG